jgi:hypothetical protein
MMKALIPTLALLILNQANGAQNKKDNGALAGVEWVEEGCDDWSHKSTLYFWAASQVETSNKPSITFSYSRWHDCSSDGAIQTYFDSYDKETSTKVVIPKNLKGGSVLSTFQAPIQIAKYRICGSDGCDTGNPEEISSEETKVTLRATFVGTGEVNPGGERGPSREATVSIVLTAKDGTPLQVPPGTVPGSIYYNGK